MKRIYLILAVLLVLAPITFFVAIDLIFPDFASHQMQKDDSVIENAKALDLWLQDLQSAGNFNGGVLVIDGGQVLLKKTYGYKDWKQTEHLNASSAFRLASLSKQFTAAAIMLLNDKDSLDYDDPVKRYLTAFPFEKVTIRHLLNNTSGLSTEYFELAEIHRTQVGDTLSTLEAVNLVCQYSTELQFESGSAYQYCNTNYVLLAAIVEDISLGSFEAFMTQDLFNPLGMRNSRVWNLMSKNNFPNKVEGFKRTSNQAIPVEPTFVDGVAGDDGIFSSLDDLVIWDQFWKDNILISNQSLAEAFKTPILVNGNRSKYGFGWMVEQNGVHWHNGNWIGAKTYIERDVSKGRVVVLLDNSSNPFFNQIREEIKEYF
ncbi:MAG: serine hydrolase domain-containing protein [Bacteroidota bacterium]